MCCVFDTDFGFVNDALDQKHHRISSITDGLHRLLMTSIPQIRSTHLSHTHRDNFIKTFKQVFPIIY